MNTQQTYVSGIVCNECNHILRTHTMDEHLDINHPVHLCPFHDANTQIANTQIITNTQYKEMSLHNKTGTLMFPEDMWDCESYCDIAALKKMLNITNKVLHVLVYMKTDPNFRNIANPDINYAHPVMVDKDMDGAYIGTWGWCCDHPIGDAIIVIDDNKKNQKIFRKKRMLKVEEGKGQAPPCKDNWRDENN